MEWTLEVWQNDIRIGFDNQTFNTVPPPPPSLSVVVTNCFINEFTPSPGCMCENDEPSPILVYSSTNTIEIGSIIFTNPERTDRLEGWDYIREPSTINPIYIISNINGTVTSLYASQCPSPS
jgi:hypothetical protein